MEFILCLYIELYFFSLLDARRRFLNFQELLLFGAHVCMMQYREFATLGVQEMPASGCLPPKMEPTNRHLAI